VHRFDGENSAALRPRKANDVGGGKMWASVTMEPGDYTFVCFLQDPKTGKPHVKLGMKKSFTVK